MSIAVPMVPYYTQESKLLINSIVTHFVLWGIGIISILLLTNKIRNRQQEIENSEEKFRILAEFSNDWEYWLSEENEMVFISPSCAQITGYREKDFTNDPHLLTSIVHPDDRHIFQNAMSSIDEPHLRACQFRIITPENKTRWLSMVWRPIYLGKRYAGKRVSNRDITDHVELREQLYQSQKMESLGVMAGGIAHDFNNILTIILGYSTLMRVKAESLGDSDLNNYVETMEQAAKQSQQIIGSLLAFSRKQVMKPVPTRISEVVNTSAKLLHRLLPADITFSIICATEELPVLVDPHQFEQVLMNLVTNARDAMPNGGKLTIETKNVNIEPVQSVQYNLPTGKYMKISVSDTGMGIDKENIQRIFEPFYTTKDQGKGTGLGLAMVYGIIKQQDGTVTVQSIKGVVTVFSMYLPVITTGLCEAADNTENKESKMLHYTGQGTILVAEDDPGVRQYLQDTLQYFGYQIIVACDGTDAIDKYNQNRETIDLVLLDVIMPKKNGREVYDQIIKDNPEQRILFMSGYTEEILSSKRIYEEKLEFIHKPLVLEELLDKLDELIKKPVSA
jgi:PAS domain S-box-containing protein